MKNRDSRFERTVQFLGVSFEKFSIGSCLMKKFTEIYRKTLKWNPVEANRTRLVTRASAVRNDR